MIRSYLCRIAYLKDRDKLIEFLYRLIICGDRLIDCFLQQSHRVNIEWFNLAIASFAAAIALGAGFANEVSENNKVMLVLDRAGWHRSPQLELPPALELELLPAYSPEKQIIDRS